MVIERNSCCSRGLDFVVQSPLRGVVIWELLLLGRFSLLRYLNLDKCNPFVFRPAHSVPFPFNQITRNEPI